MQNDEPGEEEGGHPAQDGSGYRKKHARDLGEDAEKDQEASTAIPSESVGAAGD